MNRNFFITPIFIFFGLLLPAEIFAARLSAPDTLFVYDTVKLYIPQAGEASPTVKADTAPRFKPAVGLSEQAVSAQMEASAQTLRVHTSSGDTVPLNPSAGNAIPDKAKVETPQINSRPSMSGSEAEKLAEVDTQSVRVTAQPVGLAAVPVMDTAVVEKPKGPQDSLRYFPIYLSLFPPAGIHGTGSKNHRYSFVLSPLATRTGSVYGVSISGLVSVNDYSMYGIQVSGFTTVNRGDMLGIQLSGLTTHNRGNGKGIQVTGLSTINKGRFDGVQVSGIASASYGSMRGIQVSGIASLTKKDFRGIQMGGLSATARGSMEGIQMASLFVKAGDVKGFQTAVVTKARRLRGLQLGLLNIADSADQGSMIGLLCIVRKQFYGEIELQTANYMHLGLQYTMGAKYGHTIYVLGTHWPSNQGQLMVHGLGWGTNIDLTHGFFIQPQIVSYLYYSPEILTAAIERPRDAAWDEVFVSTTHLKLGFTYYIAKHIGIKVVPSVFWANRLDSYRQAMGENPSLWADPANGKGYGASGLWGQRYIGNGPSGIGFGLQIGVSYKF